MTNAIGSVCYKCRKKVAKNKAHKLPLNDSMIDLYLCDPCFKKEAKLTHVAETATTPKQYPKKTA